MEELTLFNDLVGTYDINCANAEKRALNTVSSFEIAVFNGLRNASAQGCLKALGQLDYHFGLDREHIVERCVCLTVLTEYICTAYRSNLLYKTFEVALSEKYVDKLFGKLYVEWLKVFRGDFPPEFTSSSQFQCIQKMLKSCVNRLPHTFRWKLLFQDVILSSENYVENVKRSQEVTQMPSLAPVSRNHFPARQETKPKPVLPNSHNFSPRQEIKPKPIIGITDPSRIMQPNVPKSIKCYHDITQYMVPNTSIAPREFQESKTCNLSNSFGNVIEACIPEVSRSSSSVIDTLTKGVKSSDTVEVSSKASPVSKKKLNAFDILMKRNGFGNKKLKMF